MKVHNLRKVDVVRSEFVTSIGGSMRGTLHFDGGARPRNPGHAGCGIVIQRDGHPKYRLGRYFGFGKTNNEAEWMGLVLGIKRAVDMGVDEIDIHTDSQLIEGYFNKDWKLKAPNLIPLAREAADLLEHHFGEGGWEIHWAKRSHNSEADEICTETIKAGMKNYNPFSVKAGVRKRVEDVGDGYGQ
jgi:ribonuclease HI